MHGAINTVLRTHNAQCRDNDSHFPQCLFEDSTIPRSEGSIELTWENSNLIVVVLLCSVMGQNGHLL